MDLLDKSIILTIQGKKYDVTNFSRFHPGGNVIKFYNNLDATDVFHTFHSKSKKAFALLKALPVLETTPYKEDNDDFIQMIKKWNDAGLYKTNYYEFIIWGSVVCGITLLGLYIQMLGYPIWGGIITGIGWTHCGFVQHHAGHIGFTGNTKVDHFTQDLFEGLLKGGSGSWWRNRHNKHHAMPNSIGYDGDLRTTPFFAWDDVLVKKVPTGLLRVQHILVFPMLVLYVPLFIVSTKLFMMRKKKRFEMFLVGLHFYLFSRFNRNTSHFVLFYCIGYALQGLYLGLMFSINHMAMPRIPNISDDWFDRQLISTCNWNTDSKISMYISGFLNLQIEHHIAPQMPPENYYLIRKDIEALAKKKGIPYRKYTFWEGLCLFVYTLKETADKELSLRYRKRNCKED